MSSILMMPIPTTVNVGDIERIILAHTDGFTCMEGRGVWVDTENIPHVEPVNIFIVGAEDVRDIDHLRRAVLAYLEEHTNEVALFAPTIYTGQQLFYTPTEYAARVNSHKEAHHA